MPLKGSGVRRDGTADATVEIAGASAQKLRHVDVLLERPWAVTLAPEAGFPPSAAGLTVRIANPAAYLAQKLLILLDRPREKQAKDVLYIHDTLLMVAGELDALAAVWRAVGPKHGTKVARKLAAARSAFFAGVSDAARTAADVARRTERPNPPSAERLAAVCRLGLEQVFGDVTR